MKKIEEFGNYIIGMFIILMSMPILSLAESSLFDAIERGTRTANTSVNPGTGSNFTDTSLTTRIVKGSSINLDIILYKFSINGATINIDRTKLSRDINKSVGVFLATDDNISSSTKLVKFLGTYNNFDDNNGRISIGSFKIDKSYKKLYIQFYYCKLENMDWEQCWSYTAGTPPVVTDPNPNDDLSIKNSSSDKFSARPKKFHIDTSSLSAQINAGSDFNITLKALNADGTPTLNYNEQVSLSQSPALDYNETNTNCFTGKLKLYDANFTNGIAIVTLNYQEVGNLNIKLHEPRGSEYAKIDLDDTDFNSTSIDSLKANKDNDVYREILPFQTNINFVVDHFDIQNATLHDHHEMTDANFTYLASKGSSHDIIDTTMNAKLNIDIVAKNNIVAGGATTKNYNNICYAKNLTKISIGYLINNAIASSANPSGLTKILYRWHDDNLSSPNEKNGSNNLNNKLILTNNASISSSIFNTDHNGTAKLSVQINFDRNYHIPINPFSLNITKVDLSDGDGDGNSTITIDHNATFLYGRVKPNLHLYANTISNNINTPVSVVVYCDLGFALCQDRGIDIHNSQTDKSYWWLSTNHDNVTNSDGNIVIKAASSGALNSNPLLVAIDPLQKGSNPNISVTYTGGQKPYTEHIRLITFDDDPTLYTDEWLLHNENNDSKPKNPFYRVRFINNSSWAGYGETGSVVKTNNSASKRNKRVDW